MSMFGLTFSLVCYTIVPEYELWAQIPDISVVQIKYCHLSRFATL